MAKQNKQKLTVFQKLGNVFGKDGLNPHVKKTNKYSIGNGEILKTQSKAEFDTAKLQASQNKYLSNLWNKVDGELYQQAIHYETTRVGSYSDFETMEFYPEISATLDIFMEESTTPNDKGDIINVYSGSKRVKRILEDLFINRLDIHTSLPMWTRNLPIRKDSVIPLLDGSNKSIIDISNELKETPNKEIWTYSIQDGTSNILPSKIVWCDLTRKNSELYRVTLDNGTHIDTTPDHEFLLRNGSYLRADKLSVGVSLMPFYTKISQNERVSGYEKVYNPNSNHYKFTHGLIGREIHRDLNYENSVDDKFVTHHIDFNKFNNEPNNLVRMSVTEHNKYHANLSDFHLKSPEVTKKRMLGIDKWLRSDIRKDRMSKEMEGIYLKPFSDYNSSNLHTTHNENRSNAMTGLWENETYKASTSKKMRYKLSGKCISIIEKIIKDSPRYISLGVLCEKLKNDKEFTKAFINFNSDIKRDAIKGINRRTINELLMRMFHITYLTFSVNLNPNLLNDNGYIKAKNISNSKTLKTDEGADYWKTKPVLNHKVVSVELLNEVDDVYCMEVLGPNGEGDRHNFPVCTKDDDGNFNRDGVFVSNCKYGDNFVHLNIDQTAGIVGARQLPNFEIERRENDIHGIISPSQLEGVNADEKSNKTKFFWKGRDITFNSWQIAHFRLLGDDRKLPYGTSFLEKARRIWKQLILAEDAMLVYRVTRAPERRVYKIFVGNIDNEDVGAYVDEIANRFKRAPLIDPQTGQMDLRYNQLGIDQDIFVPTRSEDAATPIDTLPGAQNLDQISDIEYLQRKLFTALRVPKTFLGFEEPTGEGKNLALQDIRFSRTINRIQQAVLHELNKIAIIHLYLLGFHDDIDNFTITLNNPSTQAEMLKIEHTAAKVSLYKDAVADAGNGFGSMSMTRAKREILGWSDDEIKQDLLEQRIEKAAAAELENTSNVIKNTGVFDRVDRVYGDMEMAKIGGVVDEEGEGGGDAGAGGGGGGFGGGFDAPEMDLDGVESTDDLADEGGGDDFGGDELGDEGGDDFGDDTTDEGKRKRPNLIKENIKKKPKDISTKKYLKMLNDNKSPEDKINENVNKIYDKSIRFNDDLDSMINEIDNKLDDKKDE
jgi:hypothetical protein